MAQWLKYCHTNHQVVGSNQSYACICGICFLWSTQMLNNSTSSTRTNLMSDILITNVFCGRYNTTHRVGHLDDPTSSAVGHRYVAPGLKPRPGYVRRPFHLSLHLMIFGGRSAHLALRCAQKWVVKQQHICIITTQRVHVHTYFYYCVYSIIMYFLSEYCEGQRGESGTQLSHSLHFT